MICLSSNDGKMRLLRFYTFTNSDFLALSFTETETERDKDKGRRESEGREETHRLTDQRSLNVFPPKFQNSL